MKVFLFLVLFSIQNSVSYGEVSIEEQWAQCSLDYEKYSWPLKNTLVDLLNNITRDTSIRIRDECNSSLKMFAEGINDRSQWAYQCKFKNNFDFCLND